MMALDKKLHTQKKYRITTACVVILVHFAVFAFLCFLIRGCRNDFPMFPTIYHLSLVWLGWPHKWLANLVGTCTCCVFKLK